MNRILLLLSTIVPLLLLGCEQEQIAGPEVIPSDHAAVDGAAGADQSFAPSKAAAKIAFEAFQTGTGGSPPQMTWTGNVRHDRGAVATATLAGDIEAEVTAVFNGDLVQKGDVLGGPVRATGTYIVSELFGEPVTGTFESRGHGRLEISPDGVSHTGSFVGTGTGDLAGMKMHATYEIVPGVLGAFTIEGYILDPTGQL